MSKVKPLGTHSLVFSLAGDQPCQKKKKKKHNCIKAVTKTSLLLYSGKHIVSRQKIQLVTTLPMERQRSDYPISQIPQQEPEVT